MPRRRSQFWVGGSCVHSYVLDVLRNDIELFSLLMHHGRHISKQFIQFPNALFDIPDFAFSFYDQRFLEIYFILRGEAELLLFLLLLAPESGTWLCCWWRGVCVEGCTTGGSGGSFFFLELFVGDLGILGGRLGIRDLVLTGWIAGRAVVLVSIYL